MFYTYVLLSLKDKRKYIGFTRDLKKRLKEHNSGKVESTKHRTPFVLIYYEACLSEEDAVIREKYFRTKWGFKYLQKRLKHSVKT